MQATSRALAFASRWFDEATVHRTFEPLIADWQREWHDAAPSRRWRVSARGLWAFIVATLVSCPRIALTPTPSSVTNRVVTRVARFTLLATPLAIAPFIIDVQAPWRQELLLALFLVPQAMIPFFPFSMVAAVDAIRCHEALPPHVERAAVMKLGVTAVLLMIVFHGWVMPAANQAFRRESFRVSVNQATMVGTPPAVGRGPARGAREMTTIELFVDPAWAHAGETTNDGGRAATIRRELNTRASFAVLPVFFLWLRWRALDLPRRRWSPLPVSVATVMIFFCFFLASSADRFIEDAWSLRPGTGRWVPFVVLMTVGFIEQWLGRARATAGRN
jgi:hypothetical protein